MSDVKTQPERFETQTATGASPACLRWLHRIGIDTTQASRVIIDIRCDAPVAVYVQRYGNADLFEIEPPGDLRDLKASD